MGLMRSCLLTKVSVPFPGILFLNILKNKEGDIDYVVSVPFPGILFLNKDLKDALRPVFNSFRPLPGDLISQ